jgi:NAD(P)H-nitrite reductase large subunit
VEEHEETMIQTAPYVIIGNGIAGVTAAETLRTESPEAAIAVIADDALPVYYRPALKDYLAGRVSEEKLRARPASFFQDQKLYYLQERVVGLNPQQHIIHLQSGRHIPYRRLLLANGAQPRSLLCPGHHLSGVTTLRSAADYQALLARLPAIRHVVVVGGGTLALETVESMRQRGHEVTHVIRDAALWPAVLDATASDLVMQQEMHDGVAVRLNEGIAEISGERGQVNGVVTTGGAHIACQLVITAIGIEPNLDFIKHSGIVCGRGVRVDALMRTNLPDIYAAGDVVETVDPRTGQARVIGQWYPAVQQGRAAAYSMLDLLDARRPFEASMFYNATFLYGLDCAAVGLINMQGPQFQNIVADSQPRSYRKVTLYNGVPIGMLALGERREALAYKRAIDYGVSLALVASTLFADGFSLNEWLDRQGVPPLITGIRKMTALPTM